MTPEIRTTLIVVIILLIIICGIWFLIAGAKLIGFILAAVVGATLLVVIIESVIRLWEYIYDRENDL